MQNRAQLSSRGDVVAATRVTLETLSRRIEPGFAANPGAQLPEEVARHLTQVDDVERFDWEVFQARWRTKRLTRPSRPRSFTRVGSCWTSSTRPSKVR